MAQPASIGLALDLVVGARPNFVKLAPVLRALRALDRFPLRVVHTGQHYDEALSAALFRDLRMPAPDLHLGVGAGAHGSRGARILERYEAALLESRPRATVVFGDVDGTLAAARAASRLAVPVAHVEAGLRSFDLSMPEEVNRRETDRLTDLFLVTEPSGVENLGREGVSGECVRLVGNPMVDTLLAFLPEARKRGRAAALGLDAGGYGVVTLHRAATVDDPALLGALLEVVRGLARSVPLVFPVHPRTALAARAAGLRLDAGTSSEGLICLEPESYLDLVSLLEGAAVILTDSGGMPAECATLGTPCVLLRETTEHQALVESGAVRVVGRDPDRIRAAFDEAVARRWPEPSPIDLWDGHAAERIAAAIVERYGAA